MTRLVYAAIGSRGHEDGIRFAGMLADGLGLTLRLVDVRSALPPVPGYSTPTPDPFAGAPLEPETAWEAPRDLAGLARSAGVGAPESEELFGDPAEQLTMLSEAPDVELVVIPDSGDGPAWSWLTRAASRSVLDELSCPTVLIPSQGLEDLGHPARIVAGVSYGEAAPAVAAFAGRVAEAFQGTLDLVYAEVSADGSASTTALLTRCAAQVPPEVDLEVGTLNAPPAAALAAMASAPDTLIVLGRPQRGLVGSAVFGSVVHDVLKESAVPVAVVPPAGA